MPDGAVLNPLEGLETPVSPTRKNTPKQTIRTATSPGDSPARLLTPIMNVDIDDKVLKEDYILKRRENPSLIGAIDQGTSSTRFLVYTAKGRIAASAQVEHAQIYLDGHAGWHEHDPKEIWENTRDCIDAVGQALKSKGIDLTEKPLVAVGITNQRETTMAWNRKTGVPYYNAIVWDDTRTHTVAEKICMGDQDVIRDETGLPVASYFAGTRVKWLLENVEALQNDIQDPEAQGDVCFGTIDTWLIYQLTGTQSQHKGAVNVGGEFLTDVTNASRWLFLNLHTVQWDPKLVDYICSPYRIPMSSLPEVCPSAHIFGVCEVENGVPFLARVPIAAVLGDQNAALFGQTAYAAGEAKNTYGTGMFLLMNTGLRPIKSTHGSLTTISYQIGTEPVVYGLEGSVSHSGSTIQWLRDQLQIIQSAPESERLSTSSNDGKSKELVGPMKTKVDYLAHIHILDFISRPLLCSCICWIICASLEKRCSCMHCGPYNVSSQGPCLPSSFGSFCLHGKRNFRIH